MFLIYNQHKGKKLSNNKFGYDYRIDGFYTSNEVCFNYGPFDSYASINIPFCFDFLLQGKNFVNFVQLCLNKRRHIVK